MVIDKLKKGLMKKKTAPAAPQKKNIQGKLNALRSKQPETKGNGKGRQPHNGPSLRNEEEEAFLQAFSRQVENRARLNAQWEEEEKSASKTALPATQTLPEPQESIPEPAVEEEPEETQPPVETAEAKEETPPPPRKKSGLFRGRKLRIIFGVNREWEAVYWCKDEKGIVVAHETHGHWSLMHFDLNAYKDRMVLLGTLTEEEIAEVEEDLASQQGQSSPDER